MPTVIPLIPGGSLYYAMDAALRHDAPEFILKAQKAIGLAVALAAGIMIVTSLRRPIEALRKIEEETAAAHIKTSALWQQRHEIRKREARGNVPL